MTASMNKMVHVGVLSWVLLALVGCGGGGGGGGSDPVSTPAPTVSSSSTGGVFNEPQQVTLSSNGAPIYFATDGSEPTANSQR